MSGVALDDKIFHKGNNPVLWTFIFPPLIYMVVTSLEN